ncbi:hypothetical protein VP01_1151g2 [Puccinia sorghi]|uniref:Uncharacterized protein n=1 Tax=Puccinia sorghi TaxID=27349 RepID=A0A0L6VRS1_9BASI|nr:hypothetical protein VP01_1151g2 [Puccinia sorghi]
MFTLHQNISFQDSAQSFETLLKQFQDSTVHISFVGNTLYAHETPNQPNSNYATQTCEELKLDALENHFRNYFNGEVLIGQLQKLSSASGDSATCLNSRDGSVFLEIDDFNISITMCHEIASTEKEDKQQAANKQNKNNPIEKINSEKAIMPVMPRRFKSWTGTIEMARAKQRPRNFYFGKKTQEFLFFYNIR